jgi:hypothetical protein
LGDGGTVGAATVGAATVGEGAVGAAGVGAAKVGADAVGADSVGAAGAVTSGGGAVTTGIVAVLGIDFGWHSFRYKAHSSHALPSGKTQTPICPPPYCVRISNLPPCATQFAEAGLGTPGCAVGSAAGPGAEAHAPRNKAAIDTEIKRFIVTSSED